MATGAISSLGMGSGVLTSDVIDKLKTNETNLIIKPIETKIGLNAQKKQALDLLQSLTSTLKSSSFALQDSTMYQKRTVSGNNSGIEVTANTGVNLQNFSISNTILAKTNVIQSGTFSATTNSVASSAGTMNLHINGTDYKIAYDALTTYDTLKDEINNIAGNDVTASILQISDSSYNLVVNSKNTGKDQQIGIVDLGGALNSTLKSDLLRSGNFSANTATIASANGTLTLNAAGVNTNFSYTATTSLQDLADMINNNATTSSSVYASIVLNDTGTYNLAITAKNSAENLPITLTDNSTGLDTKLTTLATTQNGSFTDIQTASDASFKYNGITLTRASNTISDITVGVTIKLLSDNSNANIAITQDTKPIKDELNTFVQGYNTMVKQLDSMTLTDLAAGKVGIFNGDNSINSVGRDIRRILTSTSDTGLGLPQYGISLNRDGTIGFDSSAFDTKMAEDPTAMANFFSGQTTIDSLGNATKVDGVFTTLYSNLKNLTSAGGTITALGGGLSSEATLLQDDRKRSLALLNSRYDAMTARFIEYDTIISRLNNQFSSLSQQISMTVNGTNK